MTITVFRMYHHAWIKKQTALEKGGPWVKGGGGGSFGSMVSKEEYCQHLNLYIK